MGEEVFEKNYFKNIYNNSYDKRNPSYKFKSYLHHIKPFLKNDSLLLDIGCAYGSFLKESKKYTNIHGVDISSHAVNIAKSRLPNTKIWQSDLLSIKESSLYDVVTCFDVIEHIPQIREALRHIKTILKEDGILVITVPVYDTVVGKLVRKVDKDPTHEHKNSRYWWINMLKDEGYKVLKWKGIWRYYFENIFYLHYISLLTRSFTPAIIIIAKNEND